MSFIEYIPHSGGNIMDLHDYMNVRRVLRTLASRWNCPVWAVKILIRRTINEHWEKALSDPEEKALWDRYFPHGKPTPQQYILLLGHALESGEEIPFLLT